jgi:hypothetical protein
VNGAARGPVNAARRGIASTPGGYGANSGYDAYVGSEIDLIATWTIRPWAVLQAGYGHFFVGGYVEDSLRNVGGAKDADFLYAQLTLNF